MDPHTPHRPLAIADHRNKTVTERMLCLYSRSSTQMKARGAILLLRSDAAKAVSAILLLLCPSSECWVLFLQPTVTGEATPTSQENLRGIPFLDT